MAARDLIAELARIVGDRHVRTDPDDLAGVVVDWTGRYRGDADALVRPGDVAQTAAIVSTCRRAGVPVYTQGGNTGMVAGAVPHRPGIVLATSRLDQVGTVDHGQLEAGAGATLAAVGAAAREAGWRYPVDLAARDTATIGGTVATNAGGVHVVRHGMTRAHVVGIECITGTGAVLRDMRGLAKDNTGYHLPSLLCGSEGTLAVITAARLRLVPPEPDQATALVPVADNADAVDLGLRLARLPDIAAVEYVRADGCDLVARHLGRPSPLAGAAAGLVVEVEGPDGVIDRLAAVLDDRNALVASSRLDRQRLWQWRERHSEVLATLGTVHKLDVTVPARHLRRFLDTVDGRVHTVEPEAAVWLFGHLADGNVHVNVSGVEPDDHRVDEAVFDLITELEGSISAEHGIGRAKRAHLHRNRSPAELDVFAGIKRAFDPSGILNPGVLLP